MPKPKTLPRPEVDNYLWAEADTNGKDLEIVRRELFEVSQYRYHDFYMGSMALAGLFRCLGADYGKDSIVTALAKAPGGRLIRAVAYCKDYLVFMREHPVAKCPCCGSLVLKKEIKETPLG